MKNTKKILAGMLALSVAAGFTACGSDDAGSGAANNGGAADTTTAAETTTTTAVTVEVNTEGLKEGEDEVLENAMSQFQDVELENKEVKFLAHYNINPSGNGASKKVEVEMFEKKYGGTLKWYETTYDKRYDDLSKYVMGGEGIDFYVSDLGNLPGRIIPGMFQPVDDYIDLNSAIWQNTKNGMELYNFGGKHFMFVTNVKANYWVYYNMDTIEANGLDDPWELYQAGNWNWDTFKGMLEQFVDEENDQWGLDNWFNELALCYSAGVPTVGSVDGQLVCNLKDPTLEKAMNFQYDLYNSGLVLPMEQFNWSIQPQMMGEGKELFWIGGAWEAEGSPETWTHKIPADKLGFAPTPSPAGSDPYQAAVAEGYVLCKGATNPEGVARFAECTIVAVNDPGTIAITDRKTMDDSKWSQDLIDRVKEFNRLAREYPVVDLASGCSEDIAGYTTDGGGEVGIRAAFHGTDWASNRESIADTVILWVEEVNTELQAKVAEF